MLRTSLLLFTLISLCNLLIAQNSSKLTIQYSISNEIIIAVNPQLHINYGFAYPMTYSITIPSNSNQLRTYKKYNTNQAWSLVQEKTSNDFFNGIEAVRYDYNNNLAYISLAFSQSSDSIFIKVTNESENNLWIEYTDICKYYDNRDAVVTTTADDWQKNYIVDFNRAINIFRTRNLWLSGAIMTDSLNLMDTQAWQNIQKQLDSGYVEVLSHSRTHIHPPYNYQSEIIGSKNDIIKNLNLPSLFRKLEKEYVYAYINPNGDYNNDIDFVAGSGNYLVTRGVNAWYYDFTSWNKYNNIYEGSNVAYEIGPLYNGITDLVLLNNTFNSILQNHKIYHFFIHPHILETYHLWDLLSAHLNYISNRKNIWYTAFGHLYLYHFLEDGNYIPGSKPVQIILAPSDQSVAYTSGSTSFSVTSNTNWTVNDDASWLTISPSSGSNNGTITATYTENTNTTQRVGTITLNGGGITRTVTVTQAAVPFSLTVTPTDRSVPYTVGSTTFSITSNTNWTVSDDAAWLTVSPSSGSNDGSLTVSYLENATTIQRIVTITVTSGGITRTVTVTQESAPLLTVTPSDQYVAYTAGSTTFTVTSNRNWTVNDDADWLTITPTSGSNDETLIATYTDNTNTIQRVGTITVTGGRITRTVTLTQEATPSLTITPTEQYVAYTAGSTTFTVTSNRSWTVEDDADWLTVSPSSGSNDGTLTVAYLENTNTIQRVGTITITGGGITRTVTVTQEATPSLTVTPSDQFVAYTEGITTLAVTSNRNWTVEDNADWLTISPTSGSNDGTLTVTYTENTNTIQRVGKITVTGGGITRTVTVAQEATPLLTVIPTEHFVAYIAGSTIFTVTSNRSWTVEDDADWLTVTPTSGSNDETLTATYTDNTNTIQRVGTITVTGGRITRTVTLTQEATPSLTITPTEQYVAYTAGSTTFTVTSNRSWTVEDDADWLTVSPSNGSNDGTLTVAYLENTNTIQRVGTITITGGGITRTITLTQAAKRFLTISPLNIVLSASSGVINLIIDSNIGWQLNEEMDWIHLSKYSGYNSDTINVNYDSNENITAREGIISIYGRKTSIEVIVYQSAGDAYLIIIPDGKVVIADSGRITVNIESNTRWSIQDSISWISVIPDSGDGDGSIIFSYTANNDSLLRIGTLFFTADTLSNQFVLKQEGLEVYEITALADSLHSGTTSGSGRYLFGARAKVIAFPNQGWIFKNWKENSSIVSTDSIYNFVVSSPRTLIAKFEKILTEVKDENKLSDNFELFQNYPNPFNPVTKIRYSIPSNLKSQTSKVVLKIVDILGNEIKTLVNEEQNPGYYEAEWRAESLPNGVYFYQLRASDFISTKKMIMLK